MTYQCTTMSLVQELCKLDALLNLVDIAAYFQVDLNIFCTLSLVTFIPCALRFPQTIEIPQNG